MRRSKATLLAGARSCSGRTAPFLIGSVLLAILTSCSSEPVQLAPPAAALASEADKLLVVDCLLPADVRQLGTMAVYIPARQAIKTSQRDCAKRGGEFTRPPLQVWLPLAQQGDASAQTYVGEIFEKGLGAAPDYATAAQWYRKAADQGYSRAQINLGFLYEKGLGVKQDPIAALNLYRKAAGVSGAISLEGDSSELNALKRELDETRRELDRAKEELQRLKRFSETERENAPERTKVSQLDARVRQLESELKRRERPEAAGRPVELAGPSIQVVDPPLVLTRGVQKVTIRSGLAVREVVGRVTAPAGLVSLSVNDHLEKPDKSGLFRALIPVLGSTTAVSVVAVDRQGKRAAVEFSLVPGVAGQTQSDTPAAPLSRAAGDFGSYHALVVGDEQYQRLPKLKTAVDDANSVASLLRTKYGFETTVLLNATRYDILSALEKLRTKLTDRDNLLIYYAGHGELDQVNFRGHWLPIDAEPESRANWISNISITDILNAIKAKQVLVVADSCYSGAMTRSSLAHYEGDLEDPARAAWLNEVSSARSRTVLSSGGLKPVLDSGGGKNSVFAKAFLEVLDANQDVTEARRIYQEIAARVAYAAIRYQFEQIPEYAPIRYAGHEAGDFLFVPKAKR